MQQQIPKTIEEAYALLEDLLKVMEESLIRGTASQVLEHDTAIELAIEVGSVKVLAKMAYRVKSDKSFTSIVALLLVWREKYNSIHGAD